MTSAKSGRGASAFPPGKAFVGNLANTVQSAAERNLILVTSLVFVTRLLETEARLALVYRIFCRASRHGAIARFARSLNTGAKGLGVLAVGQADDTFAIVELRFP